MKKILAIVAVVLVVIVLVGVVVIGLSLDRAIKAGVEQVGPKVTQVEVQLDRASLSLLNGTGSMQGLLVGNPAAYQSPSAIEVGSASLSVQPRSVFADKLVVRHLRIDAPVITFEGGLRNNNLKEILDNVKSSAPPDEDSPDEEADDTAERRIQLDEFALTGARVNVHFTDFGGKDFSLTLPDVRLEDLGTGPEGLTSEELTKVILEEVLDAAVDAVIASLADEKGLGGAILKGLGQDKDSDAGKALKTLGNFLNQMKRN